MAQVLKFRRNVTDTNLLNSSGFYLLDPGWIPKVAETEEGGLPATVEEVLQMEANYSSQDNLAAGVIALHKLRQDARRYIVDRQEQYPVWLHDKLDSETGERRSLVRQVSVKQLTEPHGVGPEGSMIDAHPHYEIGVEREPWWERTEVRSLPDDEPSAAASVTYDYTGSGDAVGAHDIVGDSRARIALLDIFAPAASGNIGRIWIGLRSANKHGTLSNFVNVWECEDGVNGTNATDNADSDASGGNRVTVTPGTATWAKRMHINLGNVTANEADNYGDFLWLLRTMITAGTWEVQMRYGFGNMDDDDLVQGSIVEVDWAAYDYVELGTAAIPGRDLQCIPQSVISDASDSAWFVQLWARRTAGAGSLYLDCLCPVPIDEGWFKAWDFECAAATGGHLYFAEAPHGKRQVMLYDSSKFAGFVPYESHDFRLPIGDGRMIIVYTGPDDSSILNYIGLNDGDSGKYYERWLDLRGAE